jgi:ribosomal protein S18 acetylase RimI-like enzyme
MIGGIIMDYKIDVLKMEQLKETLDLVKSVFDEFEGPYYSEYGVENFYKFANYDNLKQMLKENLKILVAKYNDKIIGMIAYRDYSHISMLFVNKDYHYKGIARELVSKMIDDSLQNNEELKSITVNSSPYAIGFYEKIGFIKKTEEQEVDGIKFTPMLKNIQ